MIKISHPHITLIVPTKLDRETVKLWMRTARDHAPNGVIGSATVTVNGEPKESAGYISKFDGRWYHVIPLTRDLGTHEAQIVATAWNESYPEGDFEIDHSTPGESDPRYGELETTGLREIALSAAKADHSRWVSEQTNQGWSYGIRFDRRNKRDPMLMPWDNLSDRIKLGELRRFEALMGILDQMDLRLARKR
jgi:hypothetical protein